MWKTYRLAWLNSLSRYFKKQCFFFVPTRTKRTDRKNLWGAGMAQWWERSPPTNCNVSRVRFPDPASYVGWVCCWFSSLLREVFLRVLRFFPLLKNQHFQIPIRFWNARTFLNEFLWTPWCSVGKQMTFTLIFLLFLTETLVPWFACSRLLQTWLIKCVWLTWFVF